MNLLSLGAGTDISGFCSDMSQLLQIVGYFLLIFKIAIPLVIIALGMFDFGKAVVAEKEDDIKKQAKRLLLRIVAGIAIFLVPNIIISIFGLIKGYSTDKDQADFDVCETCFLHPKECPVKD